MKKIVKKILKCFISAVVIVIVIAISVALYVYFSSRTPHSGKIKVAGLQGEVNIYRDEHGVPHIEALHSDEDAFFALGFVHAQDRFWQMEFQRRIARGTLSEIFGAAALERDKYLRTWGFYRAAQAAFSAFDADTRMSIRGYTNGVNAFLQQGHFPLEIKLLGYQPQPWTETDSIVWQKMMAWDLQKSWEGKLANYMVAKKFGVDQIKVLQPPYPESAPTILSENDLTQDGLLVTSKKNLKKSSHDNLEVTTPFFDTNTLSALEKNIKIARRIRADLGFADFPDKGSNSWVIGGKLTKNGKPLLANDPHLQLSAPGLWYMAEIKGPHLHVMGATIPGLPFVIIGHNAFIGWGVTNAGVDAQDLYIEPANATFKETQEIIKVRGKPDVHFTVRASQHGPIISGVSETKWIGPTVALRWTALEPGDTTPTSFLRLNYAKNWSEFVGAMRYFVTPSQNFVYADIDGNIGYYMPGKVPVRYGWMGEFPVMPNEQYEWAGYIPFEQLPHVYNPPSAYIASANNKIVPDAYPYSLTFRWVTAPYRIERIMDLLSEKSRKQKRLTLTDMQDIQLDTVSYQWRDLREELLNTKPLDAASQEALKLLATWGGESGIDNISTTIFAFWYRELSRLIPGDVSSRYQWIEPLFIKQQLQNNGSYCKLVGYQDCVDFLSRSLQKAMMALIKLKGEQRNAWRWGDIHQVQFNGLGFGGIKSIGWLWNRHIAGPGGYATINVGTYDSNSFLQTKGAGYRQILDFSDFNNSRYILSLGQSGDIFSSHYDDQMQLWRDGQYLTMQSTGKMKKLQLIPEKK